MNENELTAEGAIERLKRVQEMYHIGTPPYEALTMAIESLQSKSKHGGLTAEEFKDRKAIRRYLKFKGYDDDCTPNYLDDIIDLIVDYNSQYQPPIVTDSWIRIEQRKPIALQSGDWDGLKSEPVLVIDKDGKHHVAVMYEGNLDGSYFYEFCDDRDFEVKNVICWMEIPFM